MTICPNCGHENEPAAKFCSQCATALAEGGKGPRTERKIVTVLFADLVGFTGRAERLDPEDVQAVLAPYHERLRYERRPPPEQFAKARAAARACPMRAIELRERVR